MRTFGKKATVILCMLMVLAPALTQAAGGRGRYLFRKDCRTCHGADGHATKLTPQSKTSEQWKAFFENDKHQAKAEVWQEVGEKNIERIQEFLEANASDVFSAKGQECWDPK